MLALKNIGSQNFRSVEKSFLLQIIDHSWKDHLLFLDYLKQGISLRAYGQKDPLNEYKREAFELFENMLLNIKRNISKVLSNIQFEQEDSQEQQNEVYKDPKLEKKNTTSIKSFKVPRNSPCTCGSGKKYKHCCGKIA